MRLAGAVHKVRQGRPYHGATGGGGTVRVIAAASLATCLPLARTFSGAGRVVGEGVCSTS